MTSTTVVMWVLILCADQLCSSPGAAFTPLTMASTEAQCKAVVAAAKDSKFVGVRAVCIGPDGSRLDSASSTVSARP